MLKTVFDPEALLELTEATTFYESCRPGLGRSLLDAVEAATLEITRHPLLWRRIKGPYRRYLIPRFPYGLIYRVDGDTIYIAAVMHLNRKPGYWSGRPGSKPS